ncbi:MAG: hypothetical protein ISP45_01215 [Reyranella sp.]|nr:hypothetical protein [Reyranella sp.]
MNARHAVEVLATRVCQAARDARKEHQAWIDIDHIRDRLGVEDLRTVDAAVAFASAKGWLSIGGRPAHSVLLNRNAP